MDKEKIKKRIRNLEDLYEFQLKMGEDTEPVEQKIIDLKQVLEDIK